MYVDLDWRSFEPEKYPGVSVEVRPLSQEALEAIQDTQSAETSLARARSIAETARSVFADHVRNVCGLEVKTDGSRRAATVEDLTKHGSFQSLVAVIVAKLITISVLTEADMGNSERPSGSSGTRDGSGNPSNESQAGQ